MSLRTRPALLAALVVGAVVAVLVVLLATREPSTDRVASSRLIGEPAPGVDGEVLLGDDFDLGTSDRWVVVNFFATWCGPCIEEHPELRAFEEEHSRSGDARVVSVVYDWTVFDSDQGRTAVDWGVAKVPESYLVAPNGLVVERFVSGVTRDQLNQVIAAYQDVGR